MPMKPALILSLAPFILPVKSEVVTAGLSFGPSRAAQEPTPPKPDVRKNEPQYEDTFSGPIVELSSEKITVSRSILGKPAEKRTFWIKQDTKVEGKLRVKTKVTVGFVTSDDGDVARLIVVPGHQHKKYRSLARTSKSAPRRPLVRPFP